jgi:hypothetical protein
MGPWKVKELLGEKGDPESEGLWCEELEEGDE